MLGCRICGNNENNHSYQGRESRIGLGDEFTYIKCSKCGCLQIECYPENIADYYSGYYSFQPPKIKEPFWTTFTRRQLFKYKISGNYLPGRLIDRIMPESFPWMLPNMIDFNSSILDIGCGSGRLVLKMANSGFRCVSGIDPFLDDDIVYRLKDGKLTIKKQDIYDLKESYDFLMLHHVLEHLPDQHRVFEQLTSLMHKESKLLINIPIIDSYAWENYGMKAFQLNDIPRHYYLHTIKSIQFLAEKYGLEIEHILFYGDNKELVKNKQTGLCCFYLSIA